MDTPSRVQRGNRRQAKRRATGVAASVMVHLLILLGLFLRPAPPVPPPELEPMVVALVTLAPPAPTPGPGGGAPPASAEPPKPAKPRPAVIKARNTPLPTDVEPLPASPTPTDAPGEDHVSDAEIASATGAGSGSGKGSGSGSGSGFGGGQCDMVAYLQAELRKSASVKRAFASAHAATPDRKAVRVWNGDWVRSHEQEGAGLAVVREAILMEVAFAPAACRSQAMRGLVVIALHDDPGSLRLALGTSQWRWSDLLSPRRAAMGGGL